MKKLSLILILFVFSFADITTSTQKSNQKSQSEKEQSQKQEQLQLQQNKILTLGKEKSINKNITNSLSFIKSFNRTASKTATGTWTIQLNPIPCVLLELQRLGWDRQAFFLTNKDLGFDFTTGEGDDEVIDLNAKDFYTQKAQLRGKISRDKLQKIQKIADEIGASMSQLAIAWILKNNRVTSVILGVSSVEQLEENLKAIDIEERLTDDVLKEINDVLNR
jgi:hypothetical protein